MKRVLFLLFIFSSGLSSLSAQCKVSKIVAEAKLVMDSTYLYDGFSLSNFDLDEKKKRIQVKFVAIKGQQYKIYFCNSGFTEEVKVSAFLEEKDGVLSKDLLGTTTVREEYIELIIKKHGNYIFEYTTPVFEDAEFGPKKNECIVSLITYKLK